VLPRRLSTFSLPKESVFLQTAPLPCFILPKGGTVRVFSWRVIGLSSLAFPRLRFRSRTRRRGFRFPRLAHGAFRRLPLDVSIERPEGVVAANSLSTAVPIRTMRCFVVAVFTVEVFLPDAPKGNRSAVGQRHRRFL